MAKEYLRHSNFLINLGLHIRQIREEKGISQEELSYRTEISRNQIGRIERGEINAGISTFYELAVGLEVDISVFFVLVK